MSPDQVKSFSCVKTLPITRSRYLACGSMTSCANLERSHVHSVSVRISVPVHSTQQSEKEEEEKEEEEESEEEDRQDVSKNNRE